MNPHEAIANQQQRSEYLFGRPYPATVWITHGPPAQVSVNPLTTQQSLEPQPKQCELMSLQPEQHVKVVLPLSYVDVIAALADGKHVKSCSSP